MAAGYLLELALTTHYINPLLFMYSTCTSHEVWLLQIYNILLCNIIIQLYAW